MSRERPSLSREGPTRPVDDAMILTNRKQKASQTHHAIFRLKTQRPAPSAQRPTRSQLARASPRADVGASNRNPGRRGEASRRRNSAAEAVADSAGVDVEDVGDDSGEGTDEDTKRQIGARIAQIMREADDLRNVTRKQIKRTLKATFPAHYQTFKAWIKLESQRAVDVETERRQALEDAAADGVDDEPADVAADRDDDDTERLPAAAQSANARVFRGANASALRGPATLQLFHGR